MADIEDDDDEFGSDDAFNDLPPNTLLQLEQQASQYIQQLPRQFGALNTGTRTAANQNQWQAQKQDSWQSERTVQPAAADDHQQQDYGYDDEDVIDLDQDPYALPQQYNAGRTFSGGGLQRNAPPGGSYVHVQAPAGTAANNASVAELQARILQLENDRTNLQKQVEDAKITAQSKAGEAAILRQKAEKAAKEYEQKVASIRFQHAEERQKQLAELERMKNEKEKLTTNNRFLEHDLAFETGKVRQLQRTQQRPAFTSTAAPAERSKQVPLQQQRQSPAVTPRKSKVLPYRDGFDDSDLVMLSPSKPKDRSKPSTPSKTRAKRKRTATSSTSTNAGNNELPAPVPSPPPQLPLSEPKFAPLPLQSGADAKLTADLARKLAQEQNKLRFMQKLLQHHVTSSSENIFEALTRFALPSNPSRKLSTALYERFSLHAPPAAIGGTQSSVSSQLTDALLTLWEQSLSEKYHAPLPIFVWTLTRIFELERFAFVRGYIPRAAPLAIATADLVAVPLARERAASSHTTSGRSKDVSGARTTGAVTNSTASISRRQQDKQSPHGKHHSPPEHSITDGEIEVLSCLQLLLRMAHAARPDLEANRVVWTMISFDFVLMFLMNGVPAEEMREMLSLLRLSALPGSFGAVAEGVERQERKENDTLDRLSVLLGEKGVDWEVREAIVDVLAEMVWKERGRQLLAGHRYAIGRLFRHLHSSITALYHHPPSRYDTAHDSIARNINKTMTLLYLLCSSSGNAQLKLEPRTDLRAKLQTLQGGMHIHLLALTRLAFAERVWFEKGVSEASREMAHEMLDEWLSPEEGEGLMMMFGSEPGSEGA